MASVDTSYLSLPHTPVKNFQDFLGSGLTEIPRLKSLVSAIKSTFKSHDNNLQMYFVEGRTYCTDVYTNKSKKVLVSRIYYITRTGSVHIYDNQGGLLVAANKKKVVYSSIPYTLDYIGAGDRLRNIIVSI